MKKIEITKRDVKVFFLGIIVMFLVMAIIDLIFNWQDLKAGFKEGYNKATMEKVK